MGNCLSCLGLDRHRNSQSSETSRLLYDDPYSNHYGSLHGGAHTTFQPNAEDIKREREALEAICQKAADSIVDIFALQPPPAYGPDPNAREHYYQDLLHNVLESSESRMTTPPIMTAPPRPITNGQARDESDTQIKTLDNIPLFREDGLDLRELGVDKGAW
ncbi:MAG: hypothetical protein M1834_009438 [Cirrosporium novae-zelandiae]|nr:MAG: hypothetical protein M1834_009438 [Cirrosporium novae-zelandiae]